MANYGEAVAGVRSAFLKGICIDKYFIHYIDIISAHYFKMFTITPAILGTC